MKVPLQRSSCETAYYDLLQLRKELGEKHTKKYYYMQEEKRPLVSNLTNANFSPTYAYIYGIHLRKWQKSKRVALTGSHPATEKFYGLFC